MALLVINGAEERLQLALCRQGCGTPSQPGKEPGASPAQKKERCAPELLAFQEWTVPGQANSVLAPSVHRLLEVFSLRATDLEGIACVNGPGSFTGLRLTLTFAEGLRAATGVPLAGLAYLELLAFAAVQRLGMSEGRLWVMTHARKGLCYAQAFEVGDLRASNAHVIPITEALEQAAAAPGLLCGSALRRYPEAVASLLEMQPHCTILPHRFDHADGHSLLAAATTAAYGSAPLAPAYLRGSDAETNLETIAQAKGLDPSEARKAFNSLTSSNL